jgi:hypothetical protein
MPISAALRVLVVLAGFVTLPVFGAVVHFTGRGDHSLFSGDLQSMHMRPDAQHPLDAGRLNVIDPGPLLSFQGPPPPEANLLFTYGPGGSFTVTGGVFGLPSATVLLRGVFLTGGVLEVRSGRPEFSEFFSFVRLTSVAPGLLAGLGLPASFQSGTGSIYHAAQIDSGALTSLSFELTAIPEPSTALLLALGLLALVALAPARI